MNLSGSKGQPERETEAKSERETKKVCVCVCGRCWRRRGSRQVDVPGDRKTGLVSPVA